MTRKAMRAAGLGAFVCTCAVVSARALAQEAAAGAGGGVLRAGAAVCDVTPPLGTSMNGGHHDRKAAHVHDPLHARALVLDDGRTKVAIVAVDSCVVGRDVFDAAKKMAEARTGIPGAHMLMCATHTHSGGTATAVFGSEPDAEYPAFMAGRIADAVACAANNLAPGRIGFASGSKPEHLFNRRWFMKPEAIEPDPFGGRNDRVRMNPPRVHPGLVEQAGPTDPELAVLCVRGEADRPVAVMANYGLHYVGGTRGDHISADYFGVFADRVQALLQADRLDPPFVGMLTNGASGDVNNIDFRSPPENLPPYRRMHLVAEDVAAEAARVIGGMRYEERIRLAATQSTLTLGVRKPSPADIEQARSMLAAMKPGDAPSIPQVYANETLKLAEYPDRVEIPLQVMRIGAAAIVAIPCEVFAEIGLEIKRASPFKPTFVVSLANGYYGYLPTAKQHELGGYETWRARSSFLAKDAATEMVKRLEEMMRGL